MTACAGLLLTGGASRRMGTDKATLLVGSTSLGAHLAGVLRAVAEGPVLEVGPGRSGLPAVPDDEPGGGPLQAIATGARALAERWVGPVLVLACDLPLLSATALRVLAGWPGDGAVVPVVAGRLQPLCARWAANDLAAAGPLVATGQRSLRGLPELPALLRATTLPADVAAATFTDVDTPEDLVALGASGVVLPSGAPGREGR